jgi:glycolate oxidase iron-sulfur subunit
MARKVAGKNLALFAVLDVEAIITACASCGMTLKKDYPTLLKDSANGDRARLTAFSQKVTDVHEFVRRKGTALPKGGEVSTASPEKTRVTFHDPCHLKRGLGVHQSPREILGSLPDTAFVEMEGADACCGFGGTFSLSHYDLAAEIGQKKADSVRNSGAQVVATGCPGCKIHIADSLHRGGAEVRVVHTMELLDGVLDAASEESRWRGVGSTRT